MLSFAPASTTRIVGSPAWIVHGLARRDAAKYLVAHVDRARRLPRFFDAYSGRETANPALSRARAAGASASACRCPSRPVRSPRGATRRATGLPRGGCSCADWPSGRSSPCNLHAARLVGAVERARLPRCRNSVVTDEWISGDEDLAPVGRIRERFDISGHAGIEDDFAGDGIDRTEGGTLHFRAVLEDELHKYGRRYHPEYFAKFAPGRRCATPRCRANDTKSAFILPSSGSEDCLSLPRISVSRRSPVLAFVTRKRL